MLTILPGGAGSEADCPAEKKHATTTDANDANQMKIAFIDVSR